jgi:hypothetical protein
MGNNNSVDDQIRWPDRRNREILSGLRRIIPCDRKLKKIERAMINTLQLATRKNLIQMSSDVITIVTVIINY